MTNLLEQKKEQLEQKIKQLKKLREEIYQLEDEEREINQYPRALKLVGRFFKYRNCYSCPKTESDFWWLYRLITSVNPNGTLEYIEFDTDSSGKLSLSTGKNEPWSSILESSSWKEIGREEWQFAVLAIKPKLSQLDNHVTHNL